MPPGCAFAPRCPHAAAACAAGVPAAVPVEPGHAAACLRAVRALVPA
jgi:peptide/nickel transport system ATP-binding protein